MTNQEGNHVFAPFFIFRDCHFQPQKAAYFNIFLAGFEKYDLLTCLTAVGDGGDGINDGGSLSGKGMLFLLATIKCIAVENSLRDKAPSFPMSANCL